MDQALARGDIHFFDHQPGVTVVTPPDEVKLAPGKSGWFSEGEVVSYIKAAEQKIEGTTGLVLKASAIYLGINGDFNWVVSPNGSSTLNSVWQLTELTGFDKSSPADGIRALDPSLKNGQTPQFHVLTIRNSDWDMTPGIEHGFWLENTFGSLKTLSKRTWIPGAPVSSPEKPQSIDQHATSNIPSRVAIFMRAEPLPQ